MKPILIFLLAFMPLSGLFAQEETPERNERIESYRIAFITEKLNLSSKEAASFWPVYNEFSQQIKSMREKDRERMRLFRDKTAPTDQEAEKFIADNLSFKQQELDLTRKYLTEFKKVLPMAKVARLITIDQEFKLQLLQQLKNNNRAQRKGF